MDKINVDCVFTNGALLRVGDLFNYDIEFLNCLGSGFERDKGFDFIKEIRITDTQLVNNCYTDLGLYCKTFQHQIITESGNSILSFECHAPRIFNKPEWFNYLKNYYNHPLNLDRKNRLSIIGVPPEIKCVMTWVRKFEPEIYQFLIDTFKVRFLTPGLNSSNYSKEMFNQLSKYNLNQANGIFYKLTHK